MTAPTRVGWWYDQESDAQGIIVPQETIGYPFDCHTADYGSGIFAGIRIYPIDTMSELRDDNPDASHRAVFRFADHMVRMRKSAEVCLMEPEFTWDEFEAGCLEVIARNADDNYLRPSIYRGKGLGVNPQNLKVSARVISRSFDHYFSDHLHNGGITLTSQGRYRRAHCGLPYRPKSGSDYGYAGIWKALAVQAGYTEPLVFDPSGQYVSECSAANLFARVGDRLFTPDPATAACLNGITRQSVIEVAAREFGMETIECPISYEFLVEADEVLATGSAAEVMGVTKIDHRFIGRLHHTAGHQQKFTLGLRHLMYQIWKGLRPAYFHWLTLVPEPVALSR